MADSLNIEYLLTRAWEEAIQASGTLVLIGVKRRFKPDQLRQVRNQLVESQRFMNELITAVERKDAAPTK